MGYIIGISIIPNVFSKSKIPNPNLWNGRQCYFDINSALNCSTTAKLKKPNILFRFYWVYCQYKRYSTLSFMIIGYSILQCIISFSEYFVLILTIISSCFQENKTGS